MVDRSGMLVWWVDLLKGDKVCDEQKQRRIRVACEKVEKRDKQNSEMCGIG